MIRPRTIVGFLIAPAIVPIVAGAFLTLMYHPAFGLLRPTELPTTDFIYPGMQYRGFAHAAEWPLRFAYAGMLLIGVPAFLLLRRTNRLTITATLMTGFVAGAVMWILYQSMSALVCIYGVGIVSLVDDWVLYTGAISPGGILGMSVAALFWLIARPDRA